jgi:hypothetical protein
MFTLIVVLSLYQRSMTSFEVGKYNTREECREAALSLTSESFPYGSKQKVKLFEKHENGDIYTNYNNYFWCVQTPVKE